MNRYSQILWKTHVEMYLLYSHSRVQFVIVPHLQNAWISGDVDSLHSVHTGNFCAAKSLTELLRGKNMFISVDTKNRVRRYLPGKQNTVAVYNRAVLSMRHVYQHCRLKSWPVDVSKNYHRPTCNFLEHIQFTTWMSFQAVVLEAWSLVLVSLKGLNSVVF
jgi:hypothetical protein